MATPEAMQQRLNKRLDDLPMFAPLIRRDCLIVVADRGLDPYRDGMGLHMVDWLADGFRRIQEAPAYDHCATAAAIDFEDRLAERIERLLDVMRERPEWFGEPPELFDGAWRPVPDESGLLDGNGAVDVYELACNLEGLSASARDMSSWLRIQRDYGPATRGMASRERYFCRLILMAFWHFGMYGSLGYSNSQSVSDQPTGKIIDFMTAMMVDETPHGITKFIQRHGKKVPTICRLAFARAAAGGMYFGA